MPILRIHDRHANLRADITCSRNPNLAPNIHIHIFLGPQKVLKDYRGTMYRNRLAYTFRQYAGC